MAVVPNGGLELVDLFGGAAADVPWPGVLFAAIVVLLLVGAIKRRSRRPRPGEIWFAQVPFRDGAGSKDRPVLVLSVEARKCTVAQFTSRDRGSRHDYLRVAGGIPGLSRASWVSLLPVRLPRSAMRRRTGEPGPALVGWYENATRR